MNTGKKVMGAFMVFAGITHFTKTAFFERMVPPLLQMKKTIVWLSGVVEILAGVLLMMNKTSRTGARLLRWLLIAVWPANVYMALTKMPLKEGQAPRPFLLWVRAALQWPLIRLASKMEKKA